MPATHARPVVNMLDSIALLLGAAFIAAPWVLGYHGNERATASSIVAGVAIIGCALVALAELPQLFEEVDVVLGVLAAAVFWLYRLLAGRVSGRRISP